MSRKRKIQIGIVLVALLVYLSMYFSVQEGILKDLLPYEVQVEEINEIEVIRASDEKIVSIKNAAEIEEFMEPFLKAEIKEVRFKEQDQKESFWITIKVKDHPSLGLQIDNENNLFVFLHEDNYMEDYVFKQNFDTQSIKALFE